MNTENETITNARRARVLTEALPYIQKYYGQVVVIKYGGNAMIDANLKRQVMEDIVLLHLVGVKVVLVHGGGPEISELMNRLGKKAQFVNGLRVTDEETVDVVQMVLAGKVNKSLVNLLGSYGGIAMGISGLDGRLIEAECKDKALGFVGKIKKINIKPVIDLLDSDYIPVISTIACGENGTVYNINGDTAAGYIAGALEAKRLIMMTDVAGVLKNPADPETLVRKITVSEAEEFKKEGIISGGMIPKVDCCIDALKHGVQKVIIMDGRVPHAILMELLTDEGAGTMVVGG